MAPARAQRDAVAGLLGWCVLCLERVGKEDFRLQGLDGETGTLLWTTILPGHNLLLDAQWGIQDARSGTTAQGPSWRIGRDGAIYGVTLTGAYKLQ
ncbi:MAG: hypothetical protein U0163_16140 [Gemmatimonadaceae bacterium]